MKKHNWFISLSIVIVGIYVNLNTKYDCIYYRDFLALNVYVALCYYKLDYYDVSQVSNN